MRKRTVAGMLAMATLAGCGATGTTHQTAPRSATPPPVQSSTPAVVSTTADLGTGTTDGSELTCNTVVDSDPSMVGIKASSLTAVQVIGLLDAAMLTDGANIGQGNPSTSDSTILFAGQEDLQNYHGGQLATDAEQYVQDSESYGGAGMQGPHDSTYGTTLIKDVTTLTKDCPSAGQVARRVMNGQAP